MLADTDESLLCGIPGSEKVLQWFGYWPSFHDAEIVSLLLDRNTNSVLKVHTFHTVAEVNKHGHYRTTKHAVISFMLKEIQALDLNDFNAQNVISGLSLSRSEEAFTIALGCCYGLCGSITARGLTILLDPGIPDSSVYGGRGSLST